MEMLLSIWRIRCNRYNDIYRSACQNFKSGDKTIVVESIGGPKKEFERNF